MKHLTRAQVAKLTGAGPKLLRHYESKGILHPVESGRATNTYHYYPSEEVLKVLDILVYRELGYNSAEIKTLLESSDYDWEGSLDRQIKELQEKRERLEGRIELAKYLKSTVGHDGERQQSLDSFMLLVKFPEYRWVLGLFEDEETVAYHEAKMDAAAMLLQGMKNLDISPDEFVAEISTDGMTTDEGKLTSAGLIHTYTFFERKCDEVLGENSDASEMPESAMSALIAALALCSMSFEHTSPEVQVLITHACKRMCAVYKRDAFVLLREWAKLAGPGGVETTAITDDVAFTRKAFSYASEAILYWLDNNGPKVSWAKSAGSTHNAKENHDEQIDCKCQGHRQSRYG